MQLITKGLQWLCLALVLFSAAFLFAKKFHTPWQHFTDQANGFLEGRLDSHFWTTQDLVEKDGKYYWPNGPFPAVFLTPFQVVFGNTFSQSSIQPLLVLGIFILAIVLARQYGYSRDDGLLLGFAFLFSSFLYAIIIDPSSWLFSQTVSLLFSLGALVIWKWKRNMLLIGFLLGCILATRPTATVFGGLFILSILGEHSLSLVNKAKQLFLLCLPIFISLALLGWFNFIRFDNVFDNGYKTNNVGPTSEPLRAIGVFSPFHIPMNFYWYFLSSFTTVTDGSAHLTYPFIAYSPWGLSLFLVAPFFMFSLGKLKIREKETRRLVTVIICTTIILLMYFNTGWYSFGPRYFADVFPILFLLNLHILSEKKLSMTHKIVIIGSALLNSFLLLTSTF